MRRRTFLVGTAGLATQLFRLPASAQTPGTSSRAAVVIGVDKADTLPVLNAAASGARQIADWLASQGFEVKLLADSDGPVEASAVYKAVSQLVARGTLDQLVIYFSGHGFLIGYGEYWMLSGAPSNPNEAVNLSGSVELARQSAIPSVVFISDACRSTADSLSANRVQGTLIFPGGGSDPNVHTYIDQFLAARPGNPAFELPVSQSIANFQGIFTASFLSAFQNPPIALVKTVNNVSYVPNRSLDNFLDNDVRRRAEAKSIKLRQRPDSRIESSDTIYIGRVDQASIDPVKRAEPDATSLQDVANVQISKAGVDLFKSGRVMSSKAIGELSVESGFDKSHELIVQNQAPQSFDTKSGFVVTGARLLSVAASSGLTAKILDGGDGLQKPGLVSVQVNNRRTGSVAIQFSEGTGTVVAALPEFVGNVVIEAGKVVNVSYLPATNGWRWSSYESERSRVDRLRAAVATSAKFGEFRVEAGPGQNRRAEQLADQIRVLKGLDPTLGLYAAYAYSEAGLLEKVASVRNFMRDDLGVDLFDVGMLSGTMTESPTLTSDEVAPFCPMLTQGWNLLQAKGVRLSPEIAATRDHLRPALWTTFDSEGLEIIRGALQKR